MGSSGPWPPPDHADAFPARAHMTCVRVLRQRSYKAAESSYNPCKVLKAHNETPTSGLRILRRRAASCWLLLAAPTCMMHLVTKALSHLSRRILLAACDTACRSACAVPQALPELLLKFGRRAHLLLLRAAGPSCHDAHTALLSALALVASTQHAADLSA